MAAAAAAGAEIAVLPRDDEVTPAEAARLLGMSRSTVARLLACGALPSRRVGNRHRIRLGDLVDYQRAITAQKEKVLADLVAYEERYGTLD